MEKVINIKVDFENMLIWNTRANLVKGDIGLISLNIETVQDITGYTMRVAFKMADGSNFLADCTAVDANHATLELPTDVLSVEGFVVAQIAVYDATDRLTSSATFSYIVNADLAEEALEASNTYPVIIQIQADISDLQADVGDVSTLATTSKEVVGAINENHSQLSQLANTTSVSAVSDVFALDVANSKDIEFEIETEDAVAKTVTVSNVPNVSKVVIGLHLIYTNASAITWFSGINWIDGSAPVLSAGKEYLMEFTSYDGGTSWIGVSVGVSVV